MDHVAVNLTSTGETAKRESRSWLSCDAKRKAEQKPLRYY
jgi:hypothetical protein